MGKAIVQVRLYEARTASGVSLRALSWRTGISRASLHRWENGLRSPTVDEVYAVAAALNITIWDLLPVVNPFA